MGALGRYNEGLLAPLVYLASGSSVLAVLPAVEACAQVKNVGLWASTGRVRRTPRPGRRARGPWATKRKATTTVGTSTPRPTLRSTCPPTIPTGSIRVTTVKPASRYRDDAASRSSPVRGPTANRGSSCPGSTRSSIPFPAIEHDHLVCAGNIIKWFWKESFHAREGTARLWYTALTPLSPLASVSPSNRSLERRFPPCLDPQKSWCFRWCRPFLPSPNGALVGVSSTTDYTPNRR